MPEILSSVACNLDVDILAASLPLMEESKVEALEWSFDTLFKIQQVPPWFLELLHAYSNENRLIGHGVFFSLFSGRWLPQQQEWLRHLKQVSTDFRFQHVTEHFGFMTGKDFHQGAPLNIPYTSSTLAIGRDRLARIQQACACPVGLENLAFSYTLDEVKRHGEFLELLVEPVEGFIILDLHNLYCQLHNFSVGYDEIIALYPLHRVREIHISGGSWEPSLAAPAKKVRRDTHDNSVPDEVFDLLRATIDKCPNLKYVVLEQLGAGLKTPRSKQNFYDDFLKMQEIVKEKNKTRIHIPTPFLLTHELMLGSPVEDEQLYAQQMELSRILETSESYEDAIRALRFSSLAYTEWGVEQWAPYMVETAMSIAQKWKGEVV